MDRKKGIALGGIAVLVIFSLFLSPVMSLLQTTAVISNYASIVVPTPLTIGLPSADVYVVRDDSAGNFVTLNGSDPYQVLETNTNPVTAINDAITKWVPTNGKLVTNGTMADWNGTVQPTHGNFTWEAWKTKATQIGSYAAGSSFYGINLEYDFITINNLTYIGESNAAVYETGIRTWTANYWTIENCTITGCSYGGILGGGVGISIRFNNISFNPNCYQIALDYASNSVISHNYVDCGGNGSCIGDFGYNDAYESNVNVTFNTLLNWGQNPNFADMSVYWHGFYNSGTAYSYIYNNTFYDAYASCGGACLIKSAYNYVFNNTFQGQQIDWAFSATQEPTGGSAWWLSANGTMFYNNILTNYAVGGIWLASTSTYSTGNITIANNTFINCGTAIQTDGTPTIMPQNDTFIGNTITTGAYGIRLGYNDPTDMSADSINILNNTIIGETYGINLYPGTTNSIVQYNHFSSCTYVIVDSSSRELTTFRFNVGLTGYYMLNVTVVGSGSAFPSGLGWQYVSGITVPVTWTPSTGYTRQDISIDGTNQSTKVSPLNVTMSANHVVIAYFVSAP